MASGFNNVPPASEFRRPTSWGRTRQPKNLAGPHETEANLVDVNGANPTTATDGYATENQRFLHLVYVEAGGATPTVTVWGYSHAFGTWGKLTDIRGNAVQITATLNSTKAQVFEISGVDRVYFKSSGTPDADDEFYAAGSTF